MKYLLAVATLTVSTATHAQEVFRVNLTQPIPYYKTLRDTLIIPLAREQYPAGTKLQVWSTINGQWYAVSIVTEHDVAAWYVRRSEMKAVLTDFW